MYPSNGVAVHGPVQVSVVVADVTDGAVNVIRHAAYGLLLLSTNVASPRTTVALAETVDAVPAAATFTSPRPEPEHVAGSSVAVMTRV